MRLYVGLQFSEKEGRYTIGNFGTFTITKRPARKGRNPQTGEAIRIKASKVLKFRPAATLKRSAGTRSLADVSRFRH